MLKDAGIICIGTPESILSGDVSPGGANARWSNTLDSAAFPPVVKFADVIADIEEPYMIVGIPAEINLLTAS
jgi:hypothetical protein